MSSLPPALAVGAHYDSLLQSALRQFFGRAVLDTEPTPSLSSDGRLAIEPSADPYALTIRWFGTRYKLRVKAWPFTPHEVRFARAIGTVLAARYRAILNPRIVAERGDLFRGMIEDRYVGAFLDDKAYAIDAREARADRIASIIELLRVAALSSYESRSISTGVLLLGTEDDPCRPGRHVAAHGAVSYAETLTGVKSFFRLADGVRTVFLANADGRLLDIIDIDRWSNEVCNDRTIDTPCSKTYQPHARATQRLGHVCAVLSPSREIKVFAEGAEVFTFRGAGWHLLDLKAKYDLWAKAVRNDALALRLFQTALDLADAREGALFVVARDPSAAVPQLVAPADRLDTAVMPSAPGATVPSRRDLLHLLAGRSVPDLDPTVFSALASIDGATVTDRQGRLLAAGAILRHPATEDYEHGGIIEGARTTAAMAASRFGPVLKVSEDGIITFFDGEPIWDI